MVSTPKTHREVTRHSRLFTRGPVDGRSREGRFLTRCRAELASHLGGDLSPVAAMLVDRIAFLQLRLMLLDERAAAGDAFSEADQRAYTSWSSALVRAMRQLGPAATPPAPSFAVITARIIADRESTAA